VGQLTSRREGGAQVDRKVAALRAHATQAGGGDGARTLALLLRLPGPARRRVLGTEWFREVGRHPGAPPLDDIFATSRAQGRTMEPTHSATAGEESATRASRPSPTPR
jgi:hypothetical protein